MKKLNWYLGFLLIGILLFASSCDTFVGRSWEDLQERIDALDERITELEENSE